MNPHAPKKPVVEASPGNRRVDLKALIGNPKLRREMCIRGIMATQAVAGIRTTYEQAARAYDKVIKGSTTGKRFSSGTSGTTQDKRIIK